jgi:translation initiation factor IF-2
MSDTTEQTTKKATLTLGSSRLKLGDIKGGHATQSLSHGRVKNVQVEVRGRKRHMIGEPNHQAENEVAPAVSANVPITDAMGSRKLGGLTEGERNNRLKVLQRASEGEKEKALLEIERAKRAEDLAAEDEIRRKEAEAAKAEIEKIRAAKEVAIEEIILPPAEDLSSPLVKAIKSSERVATLTGKDKADAEAKEHERHKARVVDEKRRSNKLTIAQAMSDNGEERMRSLASVRRAREKARRASEGFSQEKEKVIRDVIIPETITVQELANRMAERVYDVTKSLMKMGMMVTANQSIDADTAQLVVEEFGHNMKRVTDADVEDILSDAGIDTEENIVTRAPVVTFMGHVDHGKTSLLDAIRKAKVAHGEAGGITQHIGAYQVAVNDDQKITFLDTPGHEAFTAMRQRGANATDIVVLVVAADDGIMAQTVEALNHAKAAGVPIIVAINKVDKPGADPQKVRTGLLTHNMVTEDMGGDVLSVEVSAKTGLNLDKLLDAILLQSEVLDLKANPNRKAEGIVVEASVDKSRGVLSTLLVQKGTLKIGDIVVVGEAFGKVRAMRNAEGQPIKEAGPSMPVEILGLDEAPEAGVPFNVVDSEKQAREIQEYRQKRSRDLRATLQRKKGSLEDMFLKANSGGMKELPILIKGDVQGSVEAIIGSLEKLTTSEVGVRVLHSGAGGITTSDIALASASKAIIIGFNVRADANAKSVVDKEGADIRYYSIIYDIIDDIKTMLGGMLPPHIREEYLGSAEIRDVFNITKSGKVAGCFVKDGVIRRGSGVRLLRDNVVIHEGKLKTLKRFKDDAKEVTQNFECGMAFENFEDIKSGDIIEAFELISEVRTL